MPLTRLPLGTAVSGTLPAANYKAGSVIQTVQATKTNTSSMTGKTNASLGLSVDITPSFSTSKILITAMINVCSGTGEKAGIKLYRGSTSIIDGILDAPRVNAAAAYRSTTTEDSENIIIHYLDSPSTTSSTTYEIYAANRSNSGTVNMNRTQSDANNDGSIRTASVIIAQEIAG